MGVSSLWSTVPSPAWRASSSKAGARRARPAATTSHWVVAGSGMARACSSRCDAVERQAAAVLEQRDHGRGALVVLRLAHPRWRRGGKHRAAQAAAQALQLIDLRLQGRHAGDAHQDRGLLALEIHPSVAARLGAGIAVLEGGMGDRDARGTGIVLAPRCGRGPCAALGRGVAAAGGGLARGTGVRLGRALSAASSLRPGPWPWSRSRPRRRCAAPAPAWSGWIQAPRSPAPGSPPPP